MGPRADRPYGWQPLASARHCLSQPRHSSHEVSTLCPALLPLLRPGLQLLTTTWGSGDPSFYPGSHAARGVGPAPPGRHQVPEARRPSCSSEAWGHDHSVLERSVLLDVLASLPPLHVRRHCARPHSRPLSLGDLRPTGQQLPPPHPDVLGPAVSGGSTQGMGVLRETHISLPLLTQLLPQRKPPPRPRG